MKRFHFCIVLALFLTCNEIIAEEIEDILERHERSIKSLKSDVDKLKTACSVQSDTNEGNVFYSNVIIYYYYMYFHNGGKSSIPITISIGD